MASFVCDRCGKCCSSFGAFVTIERQLTGRDYYCRYALTGDLFTAHVGGPYADEVAERYEAAGSGDPAGKGSCPFLCRREDGPGFACAIHATRPQVCREFRCYRMLVYNNEGKLRGKVIGAGEIRTDDPALARIGKERIAPIPAAHPPGGNDPLWVKKVVRILAGCGYRGEAAE